MFFQDDYGFAIASSAPKVARFSLSQLDSASVSFLTYSNQESWASGFVDGTYGYMVPYYSTKLLRFHIMNFDQFDVLELSSYQLKGFMGGFHDGTYGYMIPHYGGYSPHNGHNGKLGRFRLDTFSDVEALDLSATDSSFKGFHWGFVHGGYGYLCPYSSTVKGQVVRFSLSTFSGVESLDVGSPHTSSYGYIGCFADGTSGYLIPGYNTDLKIFDLATFALVSSIDTTSVLGNNPPLLNRGFHDGVTGYALPGTHSELLEFNLRGPIQATPTAAGGAGAGASAVGDPHLQNVHGERFDLMKEGKHVLMNIPRGKDAEHALLRVQADARRLGGTCADMYFQEVNVTGSWAEAKKAGGYHYSISHHDREAPEWLAFGKVELKVVHGRTDSGLLYLNVYVKHLRRAGYAVGGLLGEDDHEDVITPPEACAGKMALVDSAGGRRPSVASFATASFE
jgi:hypothetical protein